MVVTNKEKRRVRFGKEYVQGGDTKGKDLLTLYQYHTKVAEHYFCSKCGIHTHNKPRSNPKIYGINIACVEGINPFELENVSLNDGHNHPLDQKK